MAPVVPDGSGRRVSRDHDRHTACSAKYSRSPMTGRCHEMQGRSAPKRYVVPDIDPARRSSSFGALADVHVLLVDDNKDARDITKFSLEADHAVVTTCETAWEA